MKKLYLFIIAATIIIILSGVWAYLLFFGTPKDAGQIFSNFSFFGDSSSGGEEANSTPESVVSTPTSTTPVTNVNVQGRPLQQLTTVPVVGFREITTSSTTPPEIWYAEAGTGHIHSINLLTGTQRRVSGTTIGEITKMEFTPDGSMVVAQTGFTRTRTTSVGAIDKNSLSLTLTELSDPVDTFTITTAGELLYTTVLTITTAKSRNLTTNSERILFTVPFREAQVQWGSSAGGAHIVYPKPARVLDGYLYRASGGTLTRLPVAGKGLIATPITDSLVGYTRIERDMLTSYLYSTAAGSAPASLSTLPEKCTHGVSSSTSTVFWCATPETTTIDSNFPDSWYMGDVSLRDTFMKVEVTPDFTAMTTLINTYTETNREIDAIQVTVNPTNNRLYFINKNDGTLWKYDLPQN